MTDLTIGNIFQNSFKTIQSLLVNNVIDPKNRYKTPIVKTERVFSSSQGFCGYPYIYLPPIDVGQEREVNDRSKAIKNFNFKIEVWGNQEDLTSFDKLCDEVDRILNLTATQDTLMGAGMSNVKVGDSSIDNDYDEGKPIWKRTIPIKLTRLLNVTTPSGIIPAGFTLENDDTYLCTFNRCTFDQASGKISTAASSTLTFIPGKISYAAYCDGNARIRYAITGNTFLNGLKGTVEFWFKPDWAINDGVRHILFVGDAAEDEFSIIKEAANQYITFKYNLVTQNSATLTWAANTWYHVAVTWDVNANELKIYINGVLSNGTGTSALSNVGNLTIIDFGQTANGADGSFDEARIKNVVRNATEILADYNLGNGT